MFPEDNDFILIVDDSPTNLAVLSQALKASGLKVRAAEDGESAIALSRKKVPALILLDIQMPGIDGFETCRRLKAMPETQQVPVIFMTALSDIESKVKGLSVGAVDYITKPFDEVEVIARVDVHLKLHHLNQALEQKNQELQELNQTLDQRVYQRTEALRQAQTKLVQQEKLSALGELVSGIAHEMNNPIGCIINNIDPTENYIFNLTRAIQLYREITPNLSPEEADALAQLDLEFILEDFPKILQTIRLSSHRIYDISVALRNFARLDIESKQPINLHESLDGTLLILGHRLKAVAQKPRIQVIRDYGELPFIDCYPGQLNQVFMNLIANAIDALDDAIEQGKLSDPEIQVQTAVQEEQVMIRIADNGMGIPQEIQNKMFEPMFTTKPAGKGTGLGLSISRQIIEERHHGSLTINPERTHGAEFVIMLPIQDA
ncbi:response regulator [Alkalinema sp. FACHB-956]|uniref:hybrid sensor histidine kinase/response regulator n=1 Tax=Alkalinema sp. FACHB-956 TaxID=2692768 RepID=UPI00168628BC|nr:response regulator [Alkalinema sp. FACHB-956]MBD2329152.1 response regulator [Alkalinema sp. FACHB-956]